MEGWDGTCDGWMVEMTWEIMRPSPRPPTFDIRKADVGGWTPTVYIHRTIQLRGDNTNLTYMRKDAGQIGRPRVIDREVVQNYMMTMMIALRTYTLCTGKKADNRKWNRHHPGMYHIPCTRDISSSTWYVVAQRLNLAILGFWFQGRERCIKNK